MRNTAITAALLGVLLPASFAFADTTRLGPPPPPGASGTFNGVAHVQLPSQEDGQLNVHIENSVQSSTTPPRPPEGERPPLPPVPGAQASGTPYQRGEKAGIEVHFGTTTPPGITRAEEAASSSEGAVSGYIWGENATTTSQPSGSFVSFLRWIFGLPASTTVSQPNPVLTASSTGSAQASSSASVNIPPPPPALGGFLFNFFGRFRGLFGGR